jgi:enoyl-CoA hydratase
MAEQIAAKSLPVLYAAKESLRASLETGAAEGLRFEKQVFTSLFALDDQKEGMAAFREKRAPRFTNR